ncbi:hypothetical protein [Kibdelosporangium phytohabitans]|uniref:Uncharacterized protein n=1 Tax=Kibdelosporangium phytohabitans TaxID=860235 RepID=A0A0N9IA41_9PSEU|nr:hypothetical protein [Kibdelosporangium phytohabitans]ALG13249.1 hypothetical protein AOZ06_46035 [Kibdelosporangium phytohabitans]MBE1465020.1 hypothetical protein [Kibdelosporangium phytohabitans]
MVEPNYPELRQRVRDFAVDRWEEPEAVVLLGKVRPAFDVPGRREDGTVKGKRVIRRFFWNIVRGVGRVAGFVIVLFAANDAISRDMFVRDGSVRGTANVKALGLIDAARRAKRAWLVYSQSYVAVLDSGSDFTLSDAPRPLTVLWHEQGPDVPIVHRFEHRVRWPDGFEYTYDLQGDEMEVAGRDRKAWLWRDRRKADGENRES